MKVSNSLQVLALTGVVFAVASCQQEQQAKYIPKVTSITSSDIQIQQDTALFNRVMNAPVTPDSLPNIKH
jgi:hypothetical protein